MNFKQDLLKEILYAIEYGLEFSDDGVENSQSFDIKCSINIDEIFGKLNANSKRYDIEELKYCIALLRQFDYIRTNSGYINKITTSGFKFILLYLHGVDAKY